MKNLKYSLCLLPGIFAIAGNSIGGNVIWLNIIYLLLGLVLLDKLLPEDKGKAQGTPEDLMPDFILIVSAILHTATITSLLFGVYNSNLSGYFIWLAAFSTGLCSGILGIVPAHEMIHRKQVSWRTLGIWNLILVNYAHFYVEHVKGHHKWVGTQRDPATALKGESIYAFIRRTIPGQFRSAFQIEASRLEKEGKNQFGMQNFVIKSMAIQLFLCGFIFAIFSAKILLVYLLQGLMSVLLLEYVNYIEHYGLVRNENEKYNATHAWQADNLVSRISLIELSRHSDHHLKASKPYQTLESHETSPVLPSGYFGVFYLVLIPPLWFKLVHPLLDKMEQKGNN
jgi:alkane 1-monooxygenase